MKFIVVRSDNEIFGTADFPNRNIGKSADACAAALFLQHRRNIARGTIAEKLAKSFFVIRDAILFDQSNEIGRRITGKRRLGKVRIGGNKIFRRAINVGEIAASAAGNQDLLARPVCTFQKRDAPSTLAGLDSAHQPRGPAPENQRVE